MQVLWALGILFVCYIYLCGGVCVCVYVLMCVYTCAHATAQVWRTEDNL